VLFVRKLSKIKSDSGNYVVPADGLENSRIQGSPEKSGDLGNPMETLG
jgi:hypothetical protein